MNGKRYRLLIAHLLLAIPAALQAQITGDVPITILQTTGLHHHANGADHVGLDLNPVTAMGITGAYARISAYVSSVRATAGHPVVLVDSGDWTMGTLYDLTLASRPLALSFLNLGCFSKAASPVPGRDVVGTCPPSPRRPAPDRLICLKQDFGARIGL